MSARSIADEQMLDDADPMGVAHALPIALERGDGEDVEAIGRYFTALGQQMQEDQR
jgi:hypothetical protein